jgi:hypothetical protein
MSDVTRVTVNLTGKALAALEAAAARTGDTRTDTTNRAIHLYNRLTEAVETGSGAHRLTINNVDCVLLVGAHWIKEKS